MLCKGFWFLVKIEPDVPFFMIGDEEFKRKALLIFNVVNDMLLRGEVFDCEGLIYHC